MTENFASLVVQTARLLRRCFDERARRIGMTRPQWQVLSVLAKHEGIHQSGLAEILEVEPMTVARMIDRLQEADLVERRPDPADRRAWRLHATARGLGLVDQLKPLGEETLSLALDGVSEADHAAALRALEQIRANLLRRHTGAPGSD
ncbi:MAG TPA: MarR family transcriptional regulator [Novosphingobium sp.]|nr:MarR family transcriptional regulator [Novosphingobium sp.]